MEPYIKDVRLIFGIFNPLPPCPHSGQIFSTEFTQHPLLCLFLSHLPPSCGRPLWMVPILDVRVGDDLLDHVVASCLSRGVHQALC